MVKNAVVILNWNGLSWLQKFLSRVVMFTYGQETIIYVADNGSTDGSAAWVNENFSDVRIIRMGKNNGFAGGYNLALEQIDAKYYILLNADVEVTENWLLPMISYMDVNPDVAACQPKIKSYYNKDHFEYAGAAGGFIDKFGYTFCRGRIFDRVEKDEGQYDDYADVFWASGACMVIRSEAWQKCNGFDSDFFAHMEEIDLCWRFHGAGFRVSYIPESVVYHIGGGILPYDSELKTYLNFRNNLFMLYKNLPESKLKSTIFIRKLLDGVAGAMFFLKGKFSSVKAVLKAHIDYNKSLDSLKTRREQINRSGVNDNAELIMNKSIVFWFYIKGKKTYKALTLK